MDLEIGWDIGIRDHSGCYARVPKLIRPQCALLLPNFAPIHTLPENKLEHRAWQVVGSMLLSDHFSRRYQYPNGMPVCVISQPYSPAEFSSAIERQLTASTSRYPVPSFRPPSKSRPWAVWIIGRLLGHSTSTVSTQL